MMDILGAIAICTEPYDQNKTGSRISRRDKIILPEMWRQVLVQGTYQLVVMIVLMYFGTFMFFDKSFNIITEPDRLADGSASNKLVMRTMCFHTFVLMNLFNQINCRIIDEKDINVFRTLSPFSHPIFWVVIAFEVGVQQFMINAAKT
jgi:magnesium-transporting ATPase (P-type)